MPASYHPGSLVQVPVVHFFFLLCYSCSPLECLFTFFVCRFDPSGLSLSFYQSDYQIFDLRLLCTAPLSSQPATLYPGCLLFSLYFVPLFSMLYSDVSRYLRTLYCAFFSPSLNFTCFFRLAFFGFVSSQPKVYFGIYSVLMSLLFVVYA